MARTNKRLLKPIDKRYTQDQVLDCFYRCSGVRTNICLELDASQSQLNAYLQKYPEQKTELEKARENIVYLAERKIIDLINSQDENISFKACQLTLQNLGRNHGWALNNFPQLQVNIQNNSIKEIFGLES